MNRLGGPVFGSLGEPDLWIAALRAKGYRAAYCPVPPGTDAATVAAYRAAADAADILIAEVGAWSNPIAVDEATRQAALTKCKAALALADEIGAACCVNIAGSRGSDWAGSHPDNLSEATFALIVDTVREIIDAVKPTRTVYALETMPWIFPDSVESYVRIVEAIDRAAFGVHFDPVNLVNCPARYYDTGALVRHFVAELGPRIRSVHLKDVLMHDQFIVHLDEVRPGAGTLAIDVVLRELARLDGEIPVMLEHLPNEHEYDLAAAHVRQVAADLGLSL